MKKHARSLSALAISLFLCGCVGKFPSPSSSMQDVQQGTISEQGVSQATIASSSDEIRVTGVWIDRTALRLQSGQFLYLSRFGPALWSNE